MGKNKHQGHVVQSKITLSYDNLASAPNLKSNLHLNNEDFCELFLAYKLNKAALEMWIKINSDNAFKQEEREPLVTFFPGLALIGFRTSGPSVFSMLYFVFLL